MDWQRKLLTISRTGNDTTNAHPTHCGALIDLEVSHVWNNILVNNGSRGKILMSKSDYFS